MKRKVIALGLIATIILSAALVQFTTEPEKEFAYTTRVEVDEREVEYRKDPFDITWFEPAEYTCMEYDEGADVAYLGTEQGLFIKNFTSGELRVVSFWEGLDNEHIVATALDITNGRLFIVTEDNEHIYVFDLEKGMISRKIRISANNSLLVFSRFRTLLYIPAHDSLYAGMTGGLLRLDMTDFSLKFWDFSYMRDVEASIVGGKTSFKTDFSVNAMEYSPTRDRLFMATTRGLSILDLGNETFLNMNNLVGEKDEYIIDLTWNEEAGDLAAVSNFNLYLVHDGNMSEYNLSEYVRVDFNDTYRLFEARLYGVHFLDSQTVVMVGFADRAPPYPDLNRTLSLLFSVEEEQVVAVYRHRDVLGNYPYFQGLETVRSSCIVATRMSSEDETSWNWNISYYKKLEGKATSSPGIFETEHIGDESRWTISSYGSYESTGRTSDAHSALGRIDLVSGDVEQLYLTGSIWGFRDEYPEVAFSEDVLFLHRNLFIRYRDFRETYPYNKSNMLNDRGNIGSISAYHTTSGYLGNDSCIRDGILYFVAENKEISMSFDPVTLRYETVIPGQIMEAQFLVEDFASLKVLDRHTVGMAYVGREFNSSWNSTQSSVRFVLYDMETGNTREFGPYLKPEKGLWFSSRFSWTVVSPDGAEPVFAFSPAHYSIFFVETETGEVTRSVPYNENIDYSHTLIEASNFETFNNSSDYVALSGDGLITSHSKLRNLIVNFSDVDILMSDFHILEERSSILTVSGRWTTSDGGGGRSTSFSSYDSGLYVFDYGSGNVKVFTDRQGVPTKKNENLQSVYYSEENDLVEIMASNFYASIPLSALDVKNTRPESTTVNITFRGEEVEVDKDLEFPFSPSWIATAAVILAAGATLVWFTEWLRYRFFSMLPLYTRLKKNEVASQETRDNILGAVRKDPGVTYNGLLRVLGLTNGVLAYHLMVLERERFVKSRNNSRYRHFFLWKDEIPRTLLVLNRSQLRIVEFLRRKEEGCSQGAIRSALKMSSSTVSYNLKRLRSAEYVKEKEDGEGVSLYSLPDYIEERVSRDLEKTEAANGTKVKSS